MCSEALGRQRGTDRQMGGVEQETGKTKTQKDNLVFILSSLALAALRPDGGSSPQPYRTEEGDVTPVRSPAKLCPGARSEAEPVTNPHHACRQSNLHPHGGGGGGGGLESSRPAGGPGLFLLQLIAGVLLVFVC